jgi:hypothetical protein
MSRTGSLISAHKPFGGRSLLVAIAATFLVGPLAVVSAQLAPSSVSASPVPWSPTSLPAPAALRDPSVGVDSVSCPAAGDCTAVGSFTDGSGNQQGLLLAESGGIWGAPAEADLPANAGPAPDVDLASVSCSSPGNCSAVGDYTDDSGQVRGLLLNETGGSWGAAAAPTLPADAGTLAYTVLYSVSCPKSLAGDCSAVGSYIVAGTGHALVLNEISGTWAPGEEVALPAGAPANPEAGLVSVSCASAGDCSAVGDYGGPGGPPLGLLAGESSGTWDPQGTAAAPPPGAAAGTWLQLEDVSCYQAGYCSAVGSYYDGSGDLQGALFDETSGQWAQGTEAQLPAGGPADPEVGLSSVSCVTTGNCTAVGNYGEIGGNSYEGLLINGSGGTWAPGTMARLPAGAGSLPLVALDSVSCTSPGSCTAVGDYSHTFGAASVGLTLTESNGAWGDAGVALPPGGSDLANAYVGDVSCASPGNCGAVGAYYDTSGDGQGLLISQSSGTWAPAKEAGAPDAGAPWDLSLWDISCGSAGSCAAVGYAENSNSAGLPELAVEQNGNWALAAPDLPANASTEPASYGSVGLSSVSCVPPSNCTAVGDYLDTSGYTQGLLLDETAGAWAAEEAPLPLGAGTDPQVALTAVSCALPGDCTAVGSFTDNSGHREGLVLDETSGSWDKTAAAALPANAATQPLVSLYSISCASAGNCAAVGSYLDTSADQDGLLLNEVSGTWTASEAGLPANAGSYADAAVTSVSCVLSGCSATGSYVDNGYNNHGLLLTETAGTWATGTEPALPLDAAADADAVLNGISCTSPGDCTAVGSYDDTAGSSQGLLLSQTSGSWATGTLAGIPANAGSPVDVSLAAVSCGSVGNCTAVGRYYDGSGDTQGLLLTKTAGHWAAATEAALPPDANPAQDAELTSVDCPGAGACSTTGFYLGASGSYEGLVLTGPSLPPSGLTVAAGGLAPGANTLYSLANGSVGGLAPASKAGYLVVAAASASGATDVAWSTQASAYLVFDPTSGTFLGVTAVTVVPGVTSPTCSGGTTCSLAVLTLSGTYTEGDSLMVLAAGTNPASGASDTFSWWPATSGVTAPAPGVTVQGPTAPLLFGSSVSDATVVPSTAAAATTATYTIQFKVTSAGATALSIAEPETTFPSSGPYVVTDVTGSWRWSGTANCSAGTCTLSLPPGPLAISAGDTVVVTLAGVTNPPTPGTVDDFDLSTNTDVLPVAAAPFSVFQITQTISFSPPAPGTVGGSATLAATGGASGNPVVFTVDPFSGIGVCSVSGADGATVNYAAAGTCVLDARQAGNAEYSPAAPAQASVTVSPASPPGGGGGAPPGGGGGAAPVGATTTTAPTTTTTAPVTTTSARPTTTTTTVPSRPGRLPRVAVLTKTAHVASGTATLKLRCSEAACRGTVKLWDGHLRLATSPYSLAAGQTGPVALHLTSKAVGLLAKAPHGVKAVAAAAVAGGTTIKRNVTLVLKG